MLEISRLKTYFDIGKQRTVHAVDDVSLTIPRGTVLGLVGESGSGKSTLGKTVAGLVKKNGGDIRWNGESLPSTYSTQAFRQYAKKIQMIFQDPYGSLNPRMTIGDSLAEPLTLICNDSQKQRKEKLNHWLSTVSLPSDSANRYPHEFSGGQRQRIGIARALIVEPELVICDEPISALDVSVQAQIINLMIDLQKKLDLTLLFIGHDLSMVRYISDAIAVMYMGVIVEQGPADEIFFNPLHPYTKLLIAANPLPDPKLEQQRQHRPITGEVSSPINPKAGCRFAGRCPEVSEQCRTQTPKIKPVQDRLIACHWVG